MYGRFKRAKYIRSETINQINDYQYVVELEPIHYVINLNPVSSSKTFSDFDSIFLSMYC